MTPRVVYLILLVVVIGDIITSLAFSLGWSFWNFGLYIKTPIELLFFIYSLKFVKSNLLIYVVISLFVVWLIGITTSYLTTDILLNNKVNKLYLPTDTNIFQASFKVYNRYMFLFILAVILYMYAGEPTFVSDIKKLFEGFIIINSICIVVGYIFNIGIFSSYNPNGTITAYEPRFGYKGLLYGINEITGIYFLAIAHYYRELLVYKKVKKLPIFMLIAFSALLTGAKGALLALFVLTVFYFYKYYKRIFIFVLIPAILAATLYFYAHWDIVLDSLSTISQSDSLLTIITSGRSDFMISNINYITTSWPVLNLIFGDGSLYTESDFLDLYLFFGLGGVLYLWVYIKLILKFDQTPTNVGVLVLMLLLAAINGHMIQSAVFPVFLLLYLISSANTEHKSLETSNTGVLAFNK